VARTGSVGLAAHLAGNAFICADLYTLTTLDGAVYRWASADADVVVGANTFLASGLTNPVVTRGNVTWTSTAEIAVLEVTLGSGGSALVGGKNLCLAGVDGYFYGATLKLERLFLPGWGDASLGTCNWFEGVVAGVDPSSIETVLHVRSKMERLEQMFPRFLVMPTCQNQLFDAQCGLSKTSATFHVDTTAAAGSTVTTLVTAVANPGTVTGWVVFTSGANSGKRRMISAVASSTSMTLAVPLPVAPTVGDAVTVYIGCDKRNTTCQAAPFANLLRFRGFPDVPREEASAT
jgi:uncharacterized phage protein (TIGR02218 family)